MTERFPTDPVRQALLDLPLTVAAATEPPSPQALYVVQGHERALDPDTTVVVGDRGTGKSFWSAALNGPTTRRLIAHQLPRLHLDDLDTSWGFSISSRNVEHPSRRALKDLLSEGYEAEDIWRAVILHQLTKAYRNPIDAENWRDRVRAVSADPEREERLRNEIADGLGRSGKRHLIVFDALDRTGNDWSSIRKLMRGLLQVCLELQPLQSIKAKLFMRPDMWEDSAIWEFRDSSKLHHGRVSLEWRRADLYGLLWHWLVNHAQSGPPLRQWVEGALRLRFEPAEADGEQVYVLPQALRRDENAQAQLLNSMATQYMGRDRRRGRTYTWLPNHLADAKGQVSPRSFLIAVREAQRETADRGHSQVLHWDGIKTGVQDASRIRLQELKEDYPWIQRVLEPLRGSTVPCASSEIEARWREQNLDQEILNDRERAVENEQGAAGIEMEGERFFLPPHALESGPGRGWEGRLLDDLVHIGVVRRLEHDRIDIPDLFRVAASIGRRGGVKPIR